MSERRNNVADTNQSFELDLTVTNRDKFLGLFYTPIDLDVNRRAQYKLSVLKIENGDFILDRLYDGLPDANLASVLSQKEAQEFLAAPMRAIKTTRPKNPPTPG